MHETCWSETRELGSDESKRINKMPFWKPPKFSVLLVCKANICRSPLAHGILREKLKQTGLHRLIRVDSAGTHATASKRPDQRIQAVARKNGVSLSRIKSRAIHDRDFDVFDLILVMDQSNLQSIHEKCPKEHQGKVQLLLDVLPESDLREVADPYYGNWEGFVSTYALIDSALSAWIPKLHDRFARKCHANEAE